MKNRMIALAAMAAFAAGSALATDSTLLGLVPPDAKVVAGVQVATAKASPFGQFVLSKLHPEGQAIFQQLEDATGFDPRRDVSELLMSLNGSVFGATRQGLLVASGVFDPARIQSAAAAHGCTVSEVMGVTVYAAPGNANAAVALPTPTMGILGDMDSVKGAIERYRSKAQPSDDLQKRADAASVDSSGAPNDFWFVTLAPLSEFAPKPPEGTENKTPQLNAFQSVQQASGGARFKADNVSLAAQLVMRSDKDAQSMADVIRFVAGMLQSSRHKDPDANAAIALLNTLTINTNANVTQVALVLPEAQLEQLLNTLQQHHTSRHAENRPLHIN
ncbi:MAG TPA: hypothetical protein VMJ34_18515 [Bryobacteraceae bacterium]|nr:hypothetical protein [Bryobacteraceae bacterium]